MVFFTQNKGNEARRRNARFGHNILVKRSEEIRRLL